MNRSGQYPLLAKSIATLAMLSPDPYVPWTNTMGRCVLSQSVSLTTTGHSASAFGPASLTEASTVVLGVVPAASVASSPEPTHPAEPPTPASSTATANAAPSALPAVAAPAPRRVLPVDSRSAARSRMAHLYRGKRSNLVSFRRHRRRRGSWAAGDVSEGAGGPGGKNGPGRRRRPYPFTLITRVSFITVGRWRSAP
jgi:hypothetical protein